MAKLFPVFVLLLSAAIPALADSFGISINTSSTGLKLTGSGEMVFELSNGPSTSDSISVGVSDFNLGGGVPGTVRSSQGVTGSFTGGATSLTIVNSFQTSFYDQYVTFGNKLSFTADFTFTPPAIGLPDATSDFRILVGPKNFNSANGIDAVAITYDADGVPTITHVSAATVTTTTTPEPAFLAPLGLLVLAAAFKIRRASVRRRPAGSTA